MTITPTSLPLEATTPAPAGSTPPGRAARRLSRSALSVLRSFRLWVVAGAIALAAALGTAGPASAGEGFDTAGPGGILHVYTYEWGDYGSYKYMQVQTSYMAYDIRHWGNVCRSGGSVTWTDPNGVQQHRDSVNNGCVWGVAAWQDFSITAKKGSWVNTWERVDGVWYSGPAFQVK